MMTFNKEKNHTIDSFDGKTASIPIRRFSPRREPASKSWNGYQNRGIKHNRKIFPIFSSDGIFNKEGYDIYHSNYRSYDAIHNCKSAGMIPYTIYNGTLYFLFQETNDPIRKKDIGWNDFGGKRIKKEETTAETAAREFSEETSCLFYLKYLDNEESRALYQLLKHNQKLYYDESTVKKLKKLLILSQNYYANKITEYVSPIYISSKETYISYFVRVDYIPAEDLPRAEDIHIPYENRYIRTCRWFNLNEIMELDERDFHKRLQITRIKQQIYNLYKKGLFC